MTIPLEKMPYCTAPFTALLIDPNKGVRSRARRGGAAIIPSLAGLISPDSWRTVRVRFFVFDVPK